MKNSEIVKIKWLDHVASDSWWDDNTIKELKPIEVESVGCIVCETKKYIQLVSTVSDNNCYKNIMVILKSCILEIARYQPSILAKANKTEGEE